MELLWSAFGGLAEQGIEALATGDAEELGALFDMNHALLGDRRQPRRSTRRARKRGPPELARSSQALAAAAASSR